jgi:hypothetical protein
MLTAFPSLLFIHAFAWLDCAPTPQSAPRSPSAQQPTVVGRPSEFNVVAQLSHLDDEHESPVTLCPTVGAMFLCGVFHKFEDGSFVDVGLKNGASIFGRWPDDLWSSRWETREGCGICPELLKWSGKEWKPIRVAHTGAAGRPVVWMGPWEAGQALVVQQQSPGDEETDDEINSSSFLR